MNGHTDRRTDRRGGTPVSVPIFFGELLLPLRDYVIAIEMS